MASPWTARKGLQDFIKLAAMLPEEWQIVLVGLSAKQKSSLPASIIGLERTNSAKELAQLYTAADVFFNPTYEDNYPTTNLEAISCGTPVVTYNTGGSPESAGVNGIVINKGEIGRLAFLLQFIDKDEQQILKLDKHEMFLQYLDVYKKIIKD